MISDIPILYYTSLFTPLINFLSYLLRFPNLPIVCHFHSFPFHQRKVYVLNGESNTSNQVPLDVLFRLFRNQTWLGIRLWAALDSLSSPIPYICILLMEEILHHLECINLLNCKQWDKLAIIWCRNSSINSIVCTSFHHVSRLVPFHATIWSFKAEFIAKVRSDLGSKTGAAEMKNLRKKSFLNMEKMVIKSPNISKLEETYCELQTMTCPLL